MSVIIGVYAIPDISDSQYPSWVHDHNMTLLTAKKIEKYIHLERLTRIKYDASLPNEIEKLARKLKIIPARDIKFVFVDNELGRASFSRSGQIRFEAPINSKLETTIERGRLYWFGEWAEAYSINHELAHVYSCIPFYGMFKNNSLLVHFDGGASRSNFSAWHYYNGKLKFLDAHYKLKWLSSLFNANALVFSLVGSKKAEQNSVPGKFMGLEAFGTYRPEIEEWLVENNYFEDCWSSKSKILDSIQSRFNMNEARIDNRSVFFQDVAATIHHIFIRESMNEFKRLARKTKADYLYYAGGSALNIKLNKQLLLSQLFKDIYIPPCTNDAGLSIGAAVAGALHFKESVEVTSPYLNNIDVVSEQRFNYSEHDIENAATAIYKGKVLGICNGFGEVGPRALGNRSIIARADNEKLAKKISMEYKQREWYRPVAPVILENNLEILTGEKNAPEISQYMLTEFSVLPHSKKFIEGCVHVDGTSRIQVIKKRDFNPFLYDLLLYLDNKFQIKGILNTSFNGKGEPIVQTPDQAIRSAKLLHLDYVVINGKLQKL